MIRKVGMWEMEGSDQRQQRYCGKCGAPVRPGNTFCTSCGETVAPETEHLGGSASEPVSESVSREPESSDRARPGLPPGKQSASPVDALRGAIRRILKRLEVSSSTIRGDDLRGVKGRIWQWLKDLPVAYKVVGVIVGALLLLTVLSPLATLVAALLFGVSIIALVVRAIQRRSLKEWGIVAVSSLVLTLMFSGIASVLYGIEFFGTSVPEYNIESQGYVESKRSTTLFMMVSTDSLNEEDVEAVAKDIQSRTTDEDAVAVSVYDEDLATYKNSEGILDLNTKRLYSGPIYAINISHTAVGERNSNGVPKGQYSIRMKAGPGDKSR
jgi:hypothetical protein